MRNKPFAERAFALIVLILCIAALCVPAAAQRSGKPNYTPITKVDLGVDKVELEVGESYTFKVSYEPAEPFIKELVWIPTDKSIVTADMASFSIKAEKPGRTMMMVYSFDKNAYDTCEIVVKGDNTEALSTMSGSQMLKVSHTDLAKIKAEDINTYLELLNRSSFSQTAYTEAVNQNFRALAHVKAGTEDAESKRALSLGMTNSYALKNLNVVTLEGTLEQILSFVSNNTDLEFVEGEKLSFIIDPIEEEFTDDSVAKAFNLGSNAATLTQIRKAHDLGYKGSGTTLAIIDTGLDKSHAQFKGRVIKEHCFTSNFTISGIQFEAACQGGGTESSSSKPYIYSANQNNFSHGSHAMGIAAGRDGVAPSAKIISVLAFSEAYWSCSSSNNYYLGNGRCGTNTMSGIDESRAFDWLIDVINSGTKISALNMSFGSGGYSSYCDTTGDTETEAMKKLANLGVIPVAATGNDAYVGYISSPACESKTVAVGALADRSTPYLAVYSNQSRYTDILAPGTRLYSAYLSGYGYMSGTSMATPMVTGAMGLLKQVYPDQTFDEYNYFYKYISTKSARYDENNYDYGYSKPVLDFTNFGSNAVGTLSIATNNIRGYTKGITMKFKPVKNASGYMVAIYDYKTGAYLNHSLNISGEADSTGQYQVIRFKGDILENGHPYRILVQPYRQIGQYKYYGQTKTFYGAPNPRITAITATPGNRSATFRTVKHATADGFRYNIYREGSTARFDYIDVPINGSLVKSVSGLTNGQLYYVTAIPYTKINGTQYWGASMYRIYFVPLSAPSNVRVNFTSSSRATVSMSSDSAATGIKVLYRASGGAMKNGCEARGNRCTITGLNRGSAYEFYVLKFKTVNSKKHYGPGVTYAYNTSSSNLPAPTKALIAKRGSTLLSFTITKASNARGISVLYREGEGAFKQACEAASSSCSKDGFNWNKNYTFYIMQYRNVNGRKVYSPGITVTNWLTPKSVDGDEELTNLVYTEGEEPAGLYEVLGDYYTENDLVFDEALAFLASEQGVYKSADENFADSEYGEYFDDEFFDDFGEDDFSEFVDEEFDAEQVDEEDLTTIEDPDPEPDGDVEAPMSAEEEETEDSNIFLGYNMDENTEDIPDGSEGTPAVDPGITTGTEPVTEEPITDPSEEPAEGSEEPQKPAEDENLIMYKFEDGSQNWPPYVPNFNN